MRALVIIFFLFWSLAAKADSSAIKWYKGSVVLATQEVYVGDLYIENQFDIVLVKEDSKVKVLPAHKVHAVYFYDSIENINRKFISVPEQREAYHSYRLYEIVLKGEVNVLRREKSFSDNQREEYNADGFLYYIHWNERITTLRRFRADIFPKLADSKPAINAYIRDQKLNSNLESDAIRIIDFYNHLANDEVIASR